MRVPSDNLLPEPGMQPSDTSFAMAAATQQSMKVAQASSGLVEKDLSSLSKEEQQGALKDGNSNKIIGGDSQYESKEHLLEYLRENGAARIWSTAPALKALKANPPKDTDIEILHLKEMLPGGYQGNPDEPGTSIIRTRTKAPLTS